MNEMEMLQEHATLTGLPEPGELTAARARVLAGCTQQRKSARRPRFAIGGGILVAAAAAISAFMLVSAQTPAVPPVLTAHLTAQQILDHAAAAALQQPVLTPRPDQFVYVKKYDSGPTDQTWMSVDGTRDGLRTENPGGMRGIVPGCPSSQRCTPVPAYFPTIPATAPAIVQWLEKTTGFTLTSGATYASAVSDVLDQDYLPPAQQSQLYHFLASSHKLVAVPHINDPLGRPGIGVACTVGEVTYTFIFNARSYAYLGFSEGLPHVGVAVEKIAIVDHAGELPTP